MFIAVLLQSLSKRMLEVQHSISSDVTAVDLLHSLLFKNLQVCVKGEKGQTEQSVYEASHDEIICNCLSFKLTS